MIEIVLPCYNPPVQWHLELLAFHRFITAHTPVEYILVNDGSTNGELEKAMPELHAENMTLRVLNYTENKGKGHALRKGVSACSGDQIVYTDIDFPFKNESVLNMILLLQQNKYDVLAGNRNEAYYKNKMSFFRKLLSKAFRFILKNILKMSVTDTQCGIKAFNQKGKSEFLNTKINRYLFDFEFLYKCSKNPGIQVLPVPVELKPNVVFRKMKIKILAQETINLFKVILNT